MYEHALANKRIVNISKKHLFFLNKTRIESKEKWQYHFNPAISGYVQRLYYRELKTLKKERYIFFKG